MFFVTADPEPVESKGRGRPLDPSIAIRDEEIVAKYQSGKTSTALGEEYGITRERICQILRRGNVIEHVAERKRLAREELASEAEAIKAEARAEFQQKIDAGLELLRSGLSLQRATAKVGLHINGKALLSAAAKEHGIEKRYGRWRDFTERKDRVARLLAEGLSLAEIIRQSRAAGDPLHIAWIYNHFPNVHGRASKCASAPVEHDSSHFSRAPAQPPVNPDAQWTDEKVATLRKHWIAGCSAQQCADILGGEFTRNAIIGKVGRLRAAGKLFSDER